MTTKCVVFWVGPWRNLPVGWMSYDLCQGGTPYPQLRASTDPNRQGLSPLRYLNGKMAQGRSQRLSDTPSGSPSVQTIFIKCTWAI